MLKVLELFSGVGSCSKALENLGIEHEIVDAVEIDKYAIKSFNAIHSTSFKPQDITKWDKDIKVDLIMHGSPCQDFSVAGLGAGGDEGSGTRSSLMYETIRIVKKLMPKYVIWENVKGVLSKKHVHNFNAYCDIMVSLGYKNFHKVLNAKDYGLPQNRERIFTVSIRDDGDDSQFEFPKPKKLKKRWNDLLEKEVDSKYVYPSSRILNMKVGVKVPKLKDGDPTDKVFRVGGFYDKPNDKFGKHQAGSIYDPRGIAPTLSTMQGGNREPIVITSTVPIVIRKCTPLECWLLMGFDKSSFKKAEKLCSNSQLYKQAGNSICVNVLEKILKELLNA